MVQSVLLYICCIDSISDVILALNCTFSILDTFIANNDDKTPTAPTSTSQILQLAAQFLPATDFDYDAPRSDATSSSRRGLQYPDIYQSNNAVDADGHNPFMLNYPRSSDSMTSAFPDMTFTGPFYQHLDIEQQMSKLGMHSDQQLFNVNTTEAEDNKYLDVTLSDINESFFKVDTPRRSRLAARFDMTSYERD